MSTPQDRGWGPGWPNCDYAKWEHIGHVPGIPDAVFDAAQVRQEIAPLVRLLLEETAKRGYTFLDGQCWGAACRPIRGSTTIPSNHSWGLALDFNSARNPLGSDPAKSDIPGWMVDLWGTYGFYWGGRYIGRPDPMHFEFVGSPADAKSLTAALQGDLDARKDDEMFEDWHLGWERHEAGKPLGSEWPTLVKQGWRDRDKLLKDAAKP